MRSAALLDQDNGRQVAIRSRTSATRGFNMSMGHSFSSGRDPGPRVFPYDTQRYRVEETFRHRCHAFIARLSPFSQHGTVDPFPVEQHQCNTIFARTGPGSSLRREKPEPFFGCDFEYLPYTMEDDVSSATDGIMSTVLPDSRRWRNLHLKFVFARPSRGAFECGTGTLEELQNISLPILESISVDHVDYKCWIDPHMPSFSSWNMPKLCTLRLSDCLPVSLQGLSAITDFTVCLNCGLDQFPLVDFFRVLSRMSSLRTSLSMWTVSTSSKTASMRSATNTGELAFRS